MLIAVATAGSLALAACAPYQAHKGSFYHKQRGKASWYGPGFAGRKTANGERFNPNQLTAAHRKLPFGTTVKVTNVANGKSVVVRINDRGPYAGRRIIDLSKAAAKRIGLIQSGVAMVEIETVTPGRVAKGSAPALKKDGRILLARRRVRKNGVEHLISLEKAEDESIDDEAAMEEETEEEVEMAAVPRGAADDRLSSIEESFVVTGSAPSRKPARRAPKAAPSKKPARSIPKAAPAEKSAPVDEQEF